MRLQYVTGGGQFSKYLSNKIAFFHYDIRAGQRYLVLFGVKDIDIFDII